MIAHTDTIGSLGQYVLLSSASRLSVVPTADLWITGLYGESPYLKKMLEKIGVQPDFLTCGDYKSASEIFMREGPSKEAEAMQNWLLDSLYDTQVSRIAASRKVSPELVKAWIDSGPHSGEKAKELGMVDAVEHRQDLEASLRKKFGADVVFDRKYGKKAEPRLDTSSPFGLLQVLGRATRHGEAGGEQEAGRRHRPRGRADRAGGPGASDVPGDRRGQLPDPQGARTRRRMTTWSRRSSSASIRRAARRWPARSSSTRPGG